MRGALLLLLTSCSPLVETRAVCIDDPARLPDAEAMGADAVIVPAPVRSPLQVYVRHRIADRESTLRFARGLPKVAGLVLEGLESAILDDEYTRSVFGLITGGTPEEKPEAWKRFQPSAVKLLLLDLRKARPDLRLVAWGAGNWPVDAVVPEGPSSRVVTRDGGSIRLRGSPEEWRVVVRYAPGEIEAIRRRWR